MKVSIVMATYNGEKFLLEQLESFTKQTVLPDEVIIVDDGSTDNTLSVINFFKKTAPFDIRVYSNRVNLGSTQNFNKALQLCTNELIFLSDQDDVWFSNKIEYMINVANRFKDKEVFMIDAELVDENLLKSGLTKQEQIKDLGLDDRSFVMGCCIAVRKKFLNAILPIPKGFRGHDNWIVELSDFLDLRIIDDTILQLYRRHGNNESEGTFNNLSKTNKYSIKRLIKKTLSLFKDSKIDVLKKSLQQNKLLLIGIDRLYNYVACRNENIYVSRKQTVEIINKLQARLEIIQTRKMMQRCKKVWTLYKKGKGIYKIKTALSDMFFT